MGAQFRGSDLQQAQNIASGVLIALSFPLFFLLSFAVRYRALRQLKQHNKFPVIETIVPDNAIDAIELLTHDRRWPLVFICLVLFIILTVERLDSFIVVNSITQIDTCQNVEQNVTSLVVNGVWSQVLEASDDVRVMMNTRSQAGVTEDMLTGHIPLVDNWVYDQKHDVDPYAWKSHCWLSNNHTIQNVHFNTAVLFNSCSSLGVQSVLRCFNESLIPYNIMTPPNNNTYYERATTALNCYPRSNFDSGNYDGDVFIRPYRDSDIYTSYNRSKQYYHGVIFMIQVAFNNSVGTEQYAYKLITLTIPRNIRFEVIDRTVFTIPSLSMVEYSCEAVKQRDTDLGSYVFYRWEGDPLRGLNNMAYLVARNWTKAVQHDMSTTNITLNPAIWSAYHAVHGVQGTINSTNTLAIVNESCIDVHYGYIALTCFYVLSWIACIVLKCLLWRSQVHIPDSKVDYLSTATHQLFRTDCNHVMITGAKEEGRLVRRLTMRLPDDGNNGNGTGNSDVDVDDVSKAGDGSSAVSSSMNNDNAKDDGKGTVIQGMNPSGGNELNSIDITDEAQHQVNEETDAEVNVGESVTQKI